MQKKETLELIKVGIIAALPLIATSLAMMASSGSVDHHPMLLTLLSWASAGILCCFAGMCWWICWYRLSSGGSRLLQIGVRIVAVVTVLICLDCATLVAYLPRATAATNSALSQWRDMNQWLATTSQSNGPICSKSVDRLDHETTRLFHADWHPYTGAALRSTLLSAEYENLWELGCLTDTNFVTRMQQFKSARDQAGTLLPWYARVFAIPGPSGLMWPLSANVSALLDSAVLHHSRWCEMHVARSKKGPFDPSKLDALEACDKEPAAHDIMD